MKPAGTAIIIRNVTRYVIIKSNVEPVEVDIIFYLLLSCFFLVVEYANY